MDIKEAVQKKIELEKGVVELVCRFEDQTGLGVDRIELQHATQIGNGKIATMSARAEVTLPSYVPE
jgi:hypothetical protein